MTPPMMGPLAGPEPPESCPACPAAAAVTTPVPGRPMSHKNFSKACCRRPQGLINFFLLVARQFLALAVTCPAERDFGCSSSHRPASGAPDAGPGGMCAAARSRAPATTVAGAAWAAGDGAAAGAGGGGGVGALTSDREPSSATCCTLSSTVRASGTPAQTERARQVSACKARCPRGPASQAAAHA